MTLSFAFRALLVGGAMIAFSGAIAGAGELHGAARAGDIAAIERLIAAGAGPDAEDDEALTPLVIAALGGHTQAVVALIAQGADPAGRDGNGFTALHAAAHAGHLEIVGLLLDRGLEVSDQANRAGLTPLHAAAERGFLDIAKLLLAHGADLHARSGTGHSPVFMAVLNTHADMVGLLRAAGADCSHIKLAKYRDYCMTAGS